MTGFVAGIIIGAAVAWAISYNYYRRSAKNMMATYNHALHHYAETTGRVTVIQMDEL